MIKIYSFLLFLIFIPCISFGQERVKIDSLNRLIEGNLPEQDQVEIWIKLANTHLISDADKARSASLSALSIANKLGDLELVAKASFCAGNVYLKLESFEEALVYFTKALEIFQNEGFIQDKSFLLYQNIGDVHWNQGNYYEALSAHQTAIELYRQSSDTTAISTFYNNLGKSYLDLSDYPTALNCFQKALRFDLKFANAQNLAKTHNYFGNTYNRLGNYSKAMNHYIDALTIYDSLGDGMGVTAEYFNIGLVFRSQKNYQSAFNYFFNGLRKTHALRLKKFEATAFQVIAEIHLELLQFDSASLSFSKAESLYEELNIKWGIAYIHYGMGMLLLEKGNIKEAQEKFLMALEIREKTGEQKEIAESLIQLGKVALANKELIKADAYLNRGIEISDKIGITKSKMDGVFLLSKLYSENGNFKQSNLRLLEYIELKDSLFNEEHSGRLATLLDEYFYIKERDSLKFEQEKDRLRFKEETNRLKYRQRITFLALIFVAVLTITFILFYLDRQRSNLKLKKLNQQLEDALTEVNAVNEEIATVNNQLELTVKDRTINLEKRNKMLEAIAHYNSHVIRHPVTQILGLAKVLRMSDNPSEDLEKIFPMIIKST